MSALSALAGDSDESWPVDESTPAYRGSLIEVRRDIVRGPDGDRFERDVVLHKGAVVIAALDDEDRVLVVSQYRHPTGRRLVELPAGLLDKPGEDPLEAAKRELAEEGRTEADRWTPLFTLLPSPGMTDERVIVYLADNVRETALPDGFVVQHEEATMTREWVRLDDLVDAILAGRIGNSATVAAVLALWTRRHRASPEQDAERS